MSQVIGEPGYHGLVDLPIITSEEEVASRVRSTGNNIKPRPNGDRFLTAFVTKIAFY